MGSSQAEDPVAEKERFDQDLWNRNPFRDQDLVVYTSFLEFPFEHRFEHRLVHLQSPRPSQPYSRRYRMGDV